MMFEGFVLSVLLCLTNPQDTTDCYVQSSQYIHGTEESCTLELTEQATPWATSNGLVVHDFACNEMQFPVPVGNPT